MDEQNVSTEQPTVEGTQQVVVEGTPVADQKPVDPAKDFASSTLPYHTAETEKIAAENAEQVANQEPQPYQFQANGYTVTEVEGANPQATKPEDAQKLWKATAGEFEQYFSNRRAAEIFAETHSPQFAVNALDKTPTAVQDLPKT